jgi:hypothetical protein
MMSALLALACAAMMALMCLPMAVGMLRRRLTRRTTTEAPAAALSNQPLPPSPAHGTPAPHN